jgi:predicted dehydrogenase
MSTSKPGQSRGPYRIGIVGLGVHGLGHASRLLESPSRWTLVGFSDRSVATFMRFRSSHPRSIVPFHREASELLQHRPEAVVIATPAPSHVSVAAALVEAGFAGSLLIEKPLSNSLREAERLRPLLEQAGFRGRVAVDFHRRCSALYSGVKKRISSGELGALRHVEYSRACKLSMNGAHFADLANWYVGARPASVSCRLEEHSAVDHRGAFFYDPPGLLEAVYENGVTFKMDTRREAEAKGLVVTLERGTLRVDVEESFLEVTAGGTVNRVPSDKARFGFNWIEATLASVVHGGDGFEPCGIEEGTDALAVIVAAHVSHRAGGRAVPLPLAPADKDLALRVA